MAAPVEVARLVARYEADITDFDRKTRKVEDRVEKIDRSSSRTSKGANALAGSLGKVGVAVAGAFAVGQAVNFGKAALDSFSNLQESANAVSVVFGDAKGTILDFAKDAPQAVGLASASVQQSSAVLGSALLNAGFDADTAADKTVGLTKRAADMASVFNTTVDDALGAIQAALRGEIDPIERFGVSMNAAKVEAKALELGLADTKAEITDTDKAAARLALIMEQTDRVAGDFANTSDSLANRQKILAAEWENQKAAIGEGLVPVAEALMDLWEEMGPTVLGLGQSIGSLFGAIAPLAGLIGDVLNPVLQAAVGYFDLVGKGATSIASLLGDETATQTLRLGEASDYLNERLAAGLDPMDAVANAVAHVAKGSKLTAKEFAALTKEAGLNEKEIDLVERALLDAAKAGGFLEGEYGELYRAFQRAGKEEEEEIFRLRQMHLRGRDAADTARELFDAVDDTADGLRDAIAGQGWFNQQLEDFLALDAAKEANDLADALGLVGIMADASAEAILRAKAQYEAFISGIDPGVLEAPTGFGSPFAETPGRAVTPVPDRANALGGFITRGIPTLVGERGPEVIVSRQSGNVRPDIGGGSGDNITVHITVHTDDGERVIRELERALRRRGAQVVGG